MISKQLQGNRTTSKQHNSLPFSLMNVRDLMLFLCACLPQRQDFRTKGQVLSWFCFLKMFFILVYVLFQRSVQDGKESVVIV